MNRESVDDRNEVFFNIRRAMAKRGVTYQQLSKMVGRSQKYVQNVCHGEFPLSRTNPVRLKIEAALKEKFWNQ